MVPPCILPRHFVHSDALPSDASLSLIPLPAASEPNSGAAYREERELEWFLEQKQRLSFI